MKNVLSFCNWFDSLTGRMSGFTLFMISYFTIAFTIMVASFTAIWWVDYPAPQPSIYSVASVVCGSVVIFLYAVVISNKITRRYFNW